MGDPALMLSFLGVGEVFKDADWITTRNASLVALAFAGFSLLVSFFHIVQHLRNFTMPQIQVYVIRILLTCPMYAITSSIALTLGTYGMYAEVLRDVYEAFVIYSFLNLILEFCGGETDCVHLMENEPLLKMPCPLCCMKPRARDTRLMRFCSRGVLQFIVTKPIVACIDLILLALGLFYNPIWQLVEAAVYNISYIWALYCLYVFYLATKGVIKQFRPMAKFASVKSIIFATYYQSLILKLVVANPEQAYMWNDLLLCIEMVLFSMALMCAFPVREFEGGIPDRNVLQNMKDVMQVRDIYQDVYHNFNSTYRDYALQRSESEASATAKLHAYFAGNLDRTALEMSERYRGRSKRMAFNSLLRGTRPIKAKLRRQMPEIWNTDTFNSMHAMPKDDRYSSSSSCGGVGSCGGDGSSSGGEDYDSSQSAATRKATATTTSSTGITASGSPTSMGLLSRSLSRASRAADPSTRVREMFGDAFVMDTSDHSNSNGKETIAAVAAVATTVDSGCSADSLENGQSKAMSSHIGRLSITATRKQSATSATISTAVATAAANGQVSSSRNSSRAPTPVNQPNGTELCAAGASSRNNSTGSRLNELETNNSSNSNKSISSTSDVIATINNSNGSFMTTPPIVRKANAVKQRKENLEAIIHQENERHRADENDEQEYKSYGVRSAPNFSVLYRSEGDEEEAAPLTGSAVLTDGTSNSNGNSNSSNSSKTAVTVCDAKHDKRVWLEDLDCNSPNFNYNFKPSINSNNNSSYSNNNNNISNNCSYSNNNSDFNSDFNGIKMEVQTQQEVVRSVVNHQSEMLSTIEEVIHTSPIQSAEEWGDFS